MSSINKQDEQLVDIGTDTENNTKQQDTGFQADMPPFDFHRFLEQIREPSAEVISRRTKGFIVAFNRKNAWTVNDQVKFIQDFLNYSFVRMRECDIWRDISEKEFENAKEGLEKLVMNRLYSATFAPDTTDDKEKDDILYNRISLFRWIREEHLDIPVTQDNESFFTFAGSELSKINNYKAPRDKLICILNCCKVIFGLMKHMERDEGADLFLPLLIYVVIRTNPPHLISNVQYISRFRSPDHLGSEAGYYLTNLMGAISFIETMDAKSLSISQQDFEANIERTVAEIEQELPSEPEPSTTNKEKVSYENAVHPAHIQKQQQDEEKPLIDFGTEAVQKSLNFVEKFLYPESSSSAEPIEPRPMIRRGSSTSVYQPQNPTVFKKPNQPDDQPTSPVAQLTKEQAQQQFDENLSTIVSMFPNIEPGVCFMVLQANEGRLSESIENLLDMSNEQD